MRTMDLPTKAELQAACRVVHAAMPPTPQYAWPQLGAALGAEVWVKHENHTPLGAFKLRGGITYVEALRRREPGVRGLLSATRGNHGQSVAFAARRHGLTATIVVPHGNAREKNAAMRALGAELIEHGEDFQAAREQAAVLARERQLHFVPSFHRDLLLGVASYWMEFFAAVQPEVVFVPIGLGSGLCAGIAARAALGLEGRTRLVGVVSAHAPAYRDSWRAGLPLEAPVTTQLADGMACRVPEPEALALMRGALEDIVAVTDAEVASAMRLYFSATHNATEGAGAAALAAAWQQRARWAGRKIGLVLSGGNVDRSLFARVLNEEDRA